MDKVDRLYEIYNILAESGDKIAEHEAEYLEIIDAVKGSSNEKGLACQFIPKFLKHFPNVAPTALEAQLDLVEDEDVTVRKLAVKHLPGFCKVNKNFVPKISDILTQMLLTEDSCELATVQAALVAIMELDIQGTLQGILTQISTAEEEAVRKRAIEFLNAKLKVLPADLLTKEVEDFFLESCKKVLPKVSGQDFLSLLPLLSHLKIAKTVPVQKAIVDIIASQLDMDADFDISAGNISGFMNFLKQACPFFSPFVTSKKFVTYVCLKIFPLLEDVKNLENGNILILDIFKVLAEISAYLQKDDDMKVCAEIVFKELLNYIPLPPENVGENEVADPKLYFTHIECLLYTFIQFLKQNDDIILSIDNADRFKDLKLRLQFLSRIISRALKHLRDTEKSLVVNEESKLKAIAQHTMNNLNMLVKDFFRSPPSFKSSICLSWKSAIQCSSDTNVKRHYEASSSSGNKREKRACRELYVPPGGKFSSRISFS